LLLNTSSQVDDLRYRYEANSNRLATVVDVLNVPDTRLGDFRTAATHPDAATKNLANISSITDYTYDANGNMLRDYNKAIGNSSNDGIVYNHLNLPAVISIRKADGSAKGTITYVYTATGEKIQKITVEYGATVELNGPQLTSITTSTIYLPMGLVYESKLYSNPALSSLQQLLVLQFMGQEEGRIRFKPIEGGITGTLEYDYFIKDHLGNVRMVLTEEQKQDVYPAATLENITYNGGTAINNEDDFYTINAGNVVAQSLATGIPAYQNNNGNPPYNNNAYSNVAANSARLYLLDATTNTSANKTGLGILLKVMGGDKIHIFGKSYHKKPAGGYTSGTNPLTVANIIDLFTATPAMVAKGVTTGQITGATGFPSNIATLLNDPPAQSSSRPRAGINWVILDEQFKFVNGWLRYGRG
jgi:hypothetical protein